MATGFGGSANAMGGGAMAGANSGPDLETIQTEALGFRSISGDAKVRLTSPWSSPAPTSSLLSIAPRKGLVAAAGPDQIILAQTDTVRKAFESSKDGDSDIRPFEPQLRIPMPTRISQLAFTADESYLVLTAETGGGLAVYEVQSLLQGVTGPAFELATNGETLRSMLPNPTADKAELCAIVTAGGNLHVASLKERRISNILKSQVVCISWSAKGKQLCAGLADGTIHQMTPEGEAKAQIPGPPNLGNCHVSSLTWLENNLFLAIHTSTNESPSSSIYHIITRHSPSSFTFQKLTDPVEPFGSDKAPHHTILRLRDFPPDIQDLLIVSSKASTEVGLFSRAKVHLANDKPASSIAGVFTTTELLDDTTRLTLPMTDSMDDSTPVGVALDLSSKDKVYKPIPSDEELEESPGPLPGLWILTHEGVLCSWWVVYTDSIRKGTTYSGLAAVEGTAPTSAPAQATPAASVPSFSNPGASAFGSAATQTATPAFGVASQFGQSPSTWANATSTTTPSKTGGATFGTSSFGSSPAPAPGSAFGKPSVGFGQSSQLGMRTLPWAAAGVPAPAFGQSGFARFANSGNNQSPFSAAASASPSSGGFAAYSQQGGFASVAANSGGASQFGTGIKPSSNSFGGTGGFNDSMETAFPPKENKSPGGVFGSTTFKLQSSFQPDPSQSESNEKAPESSGLSMFASAVGDALEDARKKPRASTPPGKDEDMDTEEPGSQQTPQAAPRPPLFSSEPNQESTTPTSTPSATRFGLPPSPGTPGSSLFGQPTSSRGLSGSTTETPKPASFSGLYTQANDSPKSTPDRRTEPEPEPETPKVKMEERHDPLPPESMSKGVDPLGESSSSSAASNGANQSFETSSTPSKPPTAPLPPDFLTTPKPSEPSTDAARLPDMAKAGTSANKAKETDDAPLPPDFIKPSKPAVPDAPLPPDPTESRPASKAGSALPPSGFVLPKAPSRESSGIPLAPEDDEDGSDLGEEDVSEGSGVDVAKDLSPSTSGLAPTPGFSPQSSLGGIGSTALAPSRADQDGLKRPLFGEISRNAPMLARPNATSPRSPSPVRNALPQRVIRLDAIRSVSAPGIASRILGPRKLPSQLGGSSVSKEKLVKAQDSSLHQGRKTKARREAEEARPLVDEEDEEVQRVLASEIEGTLELDEFIAHSNVAPPAKDRIPSQVEAVYRDINSMIDTLGLNSRSVRAFTKGHSEKRKQGGRSKDDLEIPDDWVLCEVSELGEVLDNELHCDLQDGRAQDIDDKLDACQDLARDMQRLRAKQEDLTRIIMGRLDPEQVEAARALPLSAEQAAQQNELRRELANFTTLLTEAEEALTLLKTRIATAPGASNRGGANVPTVDAVMRTISKMTTMAEKRSGDIDVLETHLRKMHLGPGSREGSPTMTPQTRKSMMMSPDSAASRCLRQSLSGSAMALGAGTRATPPRKKLSGFSKEEKTGLMERRARRQAVLDKFRSGVEKKGVQVWNMEDIE